jgi:hypothetical protein
MTQDDVFRSSKRSIAFLKYVVTEALNGSADRIKERTIGIEVFGRSSSYDTSLDHIVRTAATELRKRLAIYYGDERRSIRIITLFTSRMRGIREHGTGAGRPISHSTISAESTVRSWRTTR